jgi:RimJ/RimL family protein N-acetyltransferase
MNSHWRSAVSGNELFGIMGFTNISWLDKVADVCLGVVPKMRHLGVGTALAKQQNDYAFNILGLHRIQMIALADSPSCHIAAAAGLKLEGTLRQIRVKDGKRLDASVYALVKE